MIALIKGNNIGVVIVLQIRTVNIEQIIVGAEDIVQCMKSMMLKNNNLFNPGRNSRKQRKIKGRIFQKELYQTGKLIDVKNHLYQATLIVKRNFIA